MLSMIEFSLFNEMNRGTGLGWLMMLGIAFCGAVFIKTILTFAQSRLSRVLKGFKGIWDDVLLQCLAATKTWVLFFWILHPIVQSTAVTTGKKAVLLLFVFASAVQIALWGLKCIRMWRDDVVQRKISTDGESASAIRLIATGIQGLFLIALVLVGLSNLGVDIAALIAGLGVGGIAVALAAQNILGDLFGSLSILLDKPFIVGDFIVAGNDMGTVENIGIKTTRLRSLSGEELIFSNKDLLESRIKNFKRMWERRAAMNFNINYMTETSKLEAIPGWVKQFIEEDPLLRFERCHLMNFDEASLKYEIVFWVKDPDFNKYFDSQQVLMLKMIRKFDEENVSFSMGARPFYMQGPEAEEGVEAFANNGGGNQPQAQQQQQQRPSSLNS
ncbi:mechanosensitive ion channel family protein [Bdellovibrio sp. SKB1291214]|uniref:mechanosensitive ion channel family protein n=1 Tax=Bdellovibrio sp. SKB1291214 TaxID=1732569 RepID=UPI0015961AC6|nr:mechanosensitive ion channel family protein [Bdellovibrio sp. SKB1291214]UYL09631.1 mechanosensitive ion channel family protein [Bdellovibrio sp. SKB1291214]